TPDFKLAMVDFGLMGRLDKETRHYLAEILYGFVARDYDRIARIHFEAGYVPPHHSREEFALAMRSIGEPIFGKTAENMSMGAILGQLFAITESFDMHTQPHLLLLQKNMVMVEGVCRMLDPNENIWEIAKPLLENWIKKEKGMKSKAFG